MNEPTGPDAVPLSLRVQDPVAWLERRDRDPELHATLARLLDTYRVAEAVLCLEWHIGRTALVRVQVAGWDGPWAMAVTELSRNRSRRDAELVADLLRDIDSERTGP